MPYSIPSLALVQRHSREVLALAEQHAGVPALRKKVQLSLHSSLSTGQRKVEAAAVLALVREATAASPLPAGAGTLEEAEATANALAEAERSHSEVHTAFLKAVQLDSDARAELQIALNSIKSFVDLNGRGQTLSSNSFDRMQPEAYLLGRDVQAALDKAKAWYPAIVADQAAQAEVVAATRAHEKMKEACAKSPTPVNKAAEAATLARLRRSEQAARDLKAAEKTALESAEQSLQPFFQLMQALSAVGEEAAAVERARAQNIESLAAAERSRYSADDGSNSRSECTCSETQRCSYCYERQNDFATGQAYYRDKGPCD